MQSFASKFLENSALDVNSQIYSLWPTLLEVTTSFKATAISIFKKIQREKIELFGDNSTKKLYSLDHVMFETASSKLHLGAGLR